MNELNEEIPTSKYVMEKFKYLDKDMENRIQIMLEKLKKRVVKELPESGAFPEIAESSPVTSPDVYLDRIALRVTMLPEEVRRDRANYDVERMFEIAGVNPHGSKHAVLIELGGKDKILEAFERTDNIIKAYCHMAKFACD